MRNRKKDHHEQSSKQQNSSSEKNHTSSSSNSTSASNKNSYSSHSSSSLKSRKMMSSWYVPVTIGLIGIVSYFVYLGYLVSKKKLNVCKNYTNLLHFRKLELIHHLMRKKSSLSNQIRKSFGELIDLTFILASKRKIFIQL